MPEFTGNANVEETIGKKSQDLEAIPESAELKAETRQDTRRHIKEPEIPKTEGIDSKIAELDFEKPNDAGVNSTKSAREKPRAVGPCAAGLECCSHSKPAELKARDPAYTKSEFTVPGHAKRGDTKPEVPEPDGTDPKGSVVKVTNSSEDLEDGKGEVAENQTTQGVEVGKNEAHGVVDVREQQDDGGEATAEVVAKLKEATV